jgi:hypothetical protein
MVSGRLSAPVVFGSVAILGFAIVQLWGREFSLSDPRNSGSYFLTWPASTFGVRGLVSLLGCPASLLALGFIAGMLRPTKWAWLYGFASTSLFLVATLIEVTRDSTSHNLLPFEAIVYIPLSMPALLGGVWGASRRRRQRALGN